MLNFKLTFEDPEIYIGSKYQMVANGTVICVDREPIQITLPDAVEGNFTFVFKFVTDPKSSNGITNVKGIDSHTVEVQWINFLNNTIYGTPLPVPVGTLRNKPLFLSYRLQDAPSVGKTFDFNFMIQF